MYAIQIPSTMKGNNLREGSEGALRAGPSVWGMGWPVKRFLLTDSMFLPSAEHQSLRPLKIFLLLLSWDLEPKQA